MKRKWSLFIILLFLLPACRLVQVTPAQPVETHVVNPAPMHTVQSPVTPSVHTTVETGTGLSPVENPGAPETANYAIAVRLEPETRRLTGEETIIYHNTTDRPIKDLIFHLYLNAFKNEDTVFMKESGGQLRGFAFDPENAGWIEVTDISLVGGTSLDLQLVEDGTLARARLPEPIEGGQAVEIQVKFRAQLPEIFARTGWVLDQCGDPFFLVGQWFPKLGVWTTKGWVADVFHGNAEFFADFGRYQVSITLPKNYVHGATGRLTDVRQNSDGTQTAVYQAAGVIDFAWVASPNLKSASTQVDDTELVYLYLPEHKWSVDRTLEYAAGSFKTFSAWFGPYPYPRLTISDVPEEGSGAGGMEYPTFITTGAVTERDRQPVAETGWTDFLEVVTVHEMAHQWWQSMVATNEAREPWLDEGFADFATVQYFIDQYGLEFEGPDKEQLMPGFLAGRRRSFLRNPDLPIDGTAWEMPYNEYVIAAYAKPDMALLTLEGQVGEDTMREILRTYFERFRFAHPTTKEFQQVATEVSGQSLDWFFEGLVYGTDTLNWVAESIEGDTVRVVREGDLKLPVEVQVTLSNGHQQVRTCGAEKPDCTLTFKGQTVKTVLVDPERKLMIETDWTDNHLP